MTEEIFIERALELGALDAKFINPTEVATASWVRWKCQFGCGRFGLNLGCPPHSPAPSETRKVLDEYSLGILFEASRGEPTRIAAELEREIFLSGYHKAFGMGYGSCRLWEECGLEKGCRYPDKARPSMEACGIDVYATARKQGFTISVVRRREDPQNYFGLVLIS